MTLPLTPETLAAAYDYLKSTPPFNKWNLPESEDVKFRVGKQRREFASYRWNGNVHEITMSSHGIGQTATLFPTLAHEMVHMDLEEMSMDSRGTRATHNGAFRIRAAQVCKIHGWDLKAFY